MSEPFGQNPFEALNDSTMSTVRVSLGDPIGTASASNRPLDKDDRTLSVRGLEV